MLETILELFAAFGKPVPNDRTAKRIVRVLKDKGISEENLSIAVDHAIVEDSRMPSIAEIVERIEGSAYLGIQHDGLDEDCEAPRQLCDDDRYEMFKRMDMGDIGFEDFQTLEYDEYVREMEQQTGEPYMIPGLPSDLARYRGIDGES